MTKVKNEVGNKYGKLTVLERSTEKDNHGFAKWICRCDCGKIVTVRGNNLRTGQALSCGCSRAESKKTHGMSRTRLFYVWNNMKNRCYYKKHKDYENYGGRGISVCDEWVNSFDSFASWALSNGYDENAPYGSCTLDRIDPDDNYKPSNCRFADSFVQASNRRDRGLKDAPVLGADGIYHLGTKDGRCTQ